MTAVANLPSFQQKNRSKWDLSGGQSTYDTVKIDEITRDFMNRRGAPRSNSSPSIVSPNSSPSSNATVQSKLQLNGAPLSDSATDTGVYMAIRRKLPIKSSQRPESWSSRKNDLPLGYKTVSRALSQPKSVQSYSNAQSLDTHTNQEIHNVLSRHGSSCQLQKSSGGGSTAQLSDENLPILCLLSMNGTFDRKTISVPFYPESVRIGRQTNTKTTPTPVNGYFDSKVLSRQHAEIWADKHGKVWIKDIKSSNGTFVNGIRLSLENRDSEPHELETQDHLELGIDIVSEDQKTVVHRKVAAKVEYVGFAGAVKSYIETNFGDYDNITGINIGSSQGPIQKRSTIQKRGRYESANPNGGNIRLGSLTSTSNSQMSLGQQRQTKFWLTPITMEQIVKRLTHEMRIAHIQTDELQKIYDFLGSLLLNDSIDEVDKPAPTEVIKSSVSLNNMIRTAPKSFFSAPPAPPPQQPLPEKPDFARSKNNQNQSHYLKRTNTEKLRSISSIPSTQLETPSQVLNLMEALNSAKQEIDLQSVKLRDLENLLMKERKARELAEENAKRLESQIDTKTNGFLTVGLERSIVEETFEPFLEDLDNDVFYNSNIAPRPQKIDKESYVDNDTIDSMENCLDTISSEMQEAKGKSEAEEIKTEETKLEHQTNQRSLAEMVEKIRSDAGERGKFLPNENNPLDEISAAQRFPSGIQEMTSLSHSTTEEQGFKSRFKPHSFWADKGADVFGTFARKQDIGKPYLNHHTAPFASMLSIVLIGVGIMSYLNGWQIIKVER